MSLYICYNKYEIEFVTKSLSDISNYMSENNCEEDEKNQNLKDITFESKIDYLGYILDDDDEKIDFIEINNYNEIDGKSFYKFINLYYLYDIIYVLEIFYKSKNKTWKIYSFNSNKDDMNDICKDYIHKYHNNKKCYRCNGKIKKDEDIRKEYKKTCKEIINNKSFTFLYNEKYISFKKYSIILC